MKTPLKLTLDGKDRYFCSFCKRPMAFLLVKDELLSMICPQFDPVRKNPHSILRTVIRSAHKPVEASPQDTLGLDPENQRLPYRQAKIHSSDN